MTNKKVFVYSISRETATGVNNFVNDSSGKKLNKTKIGRSADSIMALYSPKVGGLANYISYTPYMNPETGTPFLNEKGQPIMLQEHLEKKWNKPAGYFTNMPWRKGDSLNDEDLTYFQQKSWQLNDGCTIFDTSDMDQELGYYVILASHMVANSEREYREHKWPRASYFIALENESEEIKYSKISLKTTAIASLQDKDMTPIIKRKFISLLGISPAKSQLSNQQIEVGLYEYIDKSSFTTGSNIDKYMELFNMRKTPSGREQFEARWLLLQALEARVIYEKQDIYTWLKPTGNLVIGDRYSEAVDYFMNPKKASEIEEIQQQIKQKQA